MSSTKQVFAAFVVCVAISKTVTAQDAADDFGRFRAQIQTGDTVRVTDRSGRETRTPIRHAAASEVERLIDRIRHRADDVTRIEVERADSLWNGALLGLAVAGTPWLIVCASNDWCYYNEYGAENFLRTTALTTAAIGAGIGALWDRSVKKRMVLYNAPGGTALKIHASPEVSGTGFSIRASATF